MDFTTGERIRKARLTAGMTQEQLGQHIYTSQQCISRIEQGQMDPRWSTIAAIAKTTQTPITFFEP
jgi:predicted transcriptional regulator